MRILSVLRMGNKNSYYHLKGLVNSQKVKKLIIIREKIIPDLNNDKVIFEIYKRPSNYLGILFILFKRIRHYLINNDVDCIISFFAFPYGLISFLLGKIYRVKAHVGFVGSDVNKYKSNWLGRLLLRLISMADIFTVTGISMKNELIELGFSKNKIYILPNAIDVENIGYNRYSSCKYDIIFIGSLVAVKNVETILRAANLAASKIERKINVCIVGDGPEKVHLNEFANNELQNCNYFFVGFQKDPFQYLYNSRIFAMASLNEGLPFSLLEAMSAGLVPVVTNVNDIPEIIKDGQNGYLFEKYDIEHAANHYVKLLTDESLYAKMRENALLIRDLYSMKNATNVWDSIF